MFKYEMTAEQANILLDIINRTQFSGVDGANTILGLVNLLKNPSNLEELEKEQFDKLKGKFEKK
jgi:hypothetical protein